MKKLFKLSNCIILCLSFFTILSCSKDEMSADTQLRVSDATAVTTNDMIGSWNLSAMIADVAIDLDENESSSKNLLDETDCFNTMYITFNQDGTFVTNNAQMTFESGAANDQFSCLTDRMDSGTWEVRENKLVLSMVLNNETFTHEKSINLGSNKFSFDITKIESDQYVNDPGNTQASPIRILELEYTKA